jgi:SNF2 family DNA or RNA helicase
MTIHVSPKHKLLGVPFNPAVQNLFPDAKVMDFAGANHLIVPHDAGATFMLRQMGFDVPAPIMSQYDWPGFQNEVFDVQKKTCALITMNQRAYVLNGMGTGKTKTILWAWDYLRGNNLCGKLLVLAPLSTLNFTWLREVFNTLPHRKAVVLHGTRQQRLDKLADPEAEIFIINHDGLKIIQKELAARKDIDVLAIDELAVYRNSGSDRSKVCKKVAAGMRWVWGATGAPIPTSPTDVYGQARIVTPNTVPKYFNSFRDELMTRVSQFTFLPKPDAVDRAFAALQPAVRYSLDDVVELPELIERDVDVDLGPKQAKVYKEMAKHCYSLVQSQEITAVNAGVAMMKLLQVAIGWVYAKDGSVVPLDNDKRIQAMVDAAMATDRKVLIFVPFKHALAGISAALTAENIEHACVSGDTSMNERSRIFNAFQNTNQYHAIAAHPQCLAHGVTLTAADTIIWFGPITSFEIYDQANKRIRRIGQKHKQLILNFHSTPVEKKIYRALRNNEAVQNKLLDMFEEISE